MHASNRGGDLSNLRTAPQTSCNTSYVQLMPGVRPPGRALGVGTAKWISLVILGLIHGTNTELAFLGNQGWAGDVRASNQIRLGVQFLSGRNARLNLLPLRVGPGTGTESFCTGGVRFSSRGLAESFVRAGGYCGF